MPHRRTLRRSAGSPDTAPLPPRPPRYRFATVDPGLRLERRRNPQRRAKVDAILATITDQRQREEYLSTVRAPTGRQLVS